MKTTQPNFEIIKTAIYQAASKSTLPEMSILFMHITAGQRSGTIYHELRILNKDFHEWLNRLDIRSATSLIDKCKEKMIALPKWIEQKQFVIDYNDRDTLDLIRI